MNVWGEKRGVLFLDLVVREKGVVDMIPKCPRYRVDLDSPSGGGGGVGGGGGSRKDIRSDSINHGRRTISGLQAAEASIHS